MLPTRLQLNPEMRCIRRPLAKQLTTCENTFPLFVLDLAGSANAPWIPQRIPGAFLYAQRDLAGEYVQKLRELVEGGLAQKAPDTRDAGVVVHLALALPLR